MFFFHKAGRRMGHHNKVVLYHVYHVVSLSLAKMMYIYVSTKFGDDSFHLLAGI